jgi:BetI-type transcriptional repressor, C-terminal
LRQPDLLALSRAAMIEAVDGLSIAITRGQAAGQLNPGLMPQQAATMLIALIDGLLWQATLVGVEWMAEQLPFIKEAVARMLIQPWPAG